MTKEIKQQGLKPLTDDHRDLTSLGALIKWPKLEELPAHFSYPTLSIKDQIADGNDDFCASCAGAVMKELQEDDVPTP